MPDQVFIYLIIVLNTLVQCMLIRSLNFAPGGKRKYYMCAIAIPLLVMVIMRLLIAGGAMEGRVVEQSPFERYMTIAASVLLLAGPWLVTLAAIFDRQRRGWLGKSNEEPTKPM